MNAEELPFDTHERADGNFCPPPPPSKATHFICNILRRADIEVGGQRPWDIDVLNTQFFNRVLVQGRCGLGDSYIEGWWNCRSLDQFFARLCRSGLEDATPSLSDTVSLLKAKFLNLQTRRRSVEVARRHYDLGNELYRRMLDKRMNYSCAYWEKAQTLDDAQEAKLDLICQKLELAPGMKMLDIGCGWGALLRFAAEKYGVHGVGVTLSTEQARFAQHFCKNLPVEILVQDYRELNSTFDRVASVGMFEHVGYKNYRTFMKTAQTCLKDDGLFLLHTIGSNQSCVDIDPWIHKHIFPNSMLPSARQISDASEKLFIIEDWHNFGVHYDRTLMAWFENFSAQWPQIKVRLDLDDTFFRKWKYYLLMCAGTFRARKNQLWQIVFSKNGKLGGYRSRR